MTNPALRDAFERDGVVRVPGVVAADALGPMRDRLRERIAELEFAETAGALRPARGTELAWWEVGREPTFASLPGALATALERVFGPGVWAQAEGELGGLAMPNLPCPGVPWTACAAAWHVDDATPPGHVPAGVLLGFTCLDRVEPRGGATVALAGSHRRLALLADQLGTPTTTEVALAGLAEQEPWFADLLGGDGRPPAEGCLSAGIPLRLYELSGEPGDVLLMDPRCLHTTSANVSPRPRLTMRTTWLRVAAERSEGNPARGRPRGRADPRPA